MPLWRKLASKPAPQLKSHSHGYDSLLYYPVAASTESDRVAAVPLTL